MQTQPIVADLQMRQEKKRKVTAGVQSIQSQEVWGKLCTACARCLGMHILFKNRNSARVITQFLGILPYKQAACVSGYFSHF